MSNITGIDLQMQGLSEGTSYLPLRSKFTVELQQPLSLSLNGKQWSTRLVVSYVNLEELGNLQEVIESIKAYKARGRQKIKKGLPSWGPWFPGYSPFWRQGIQTLLFCWTLFSVVWGLWQLHQHFSLFRHLITYFREKLHQFLSPLLGVFYDVIESFMNTAGALLESYLDPLQVLFVSMWGPFWPVLQRCFSSSLSAIRLMKSPVYSAVTQLGDVLLLLVRQLGTPLVSLFAGVKDASLLFLRVVFQPVRDLLRHFLEPVTYAWSVIRGPFAPLFRALSTALLLLTSLLRSLLSTVAFPLSFLSEGVKETLFTFGQSLYTALQRASRFEFDAKKEYVLKIFRIAQDNTRTVALGMTRLTTALPDVRAEITQDISMIKEDIKDKIREHTSSRSGRLSSGSSETESNSSLSSSLAGGGEEERGSAKGGNRFPVSLSEDDVEESSSSSNSVAGIPKEGERGLTEREVLLSLFESIHQGSSTSDVTLSVVASSKEKEDGGRNERGNGKTDRRERAELGEKGTEEKEEKEEEGVVSPNVSLMGLRKRILPRTALVPQLERELDPVRGLV